MNSIVMTSNTKATGAQPSGEAWTASGFLTSGGCFAHRATLPSRTQTCLSTAAVSQAVAMSKKQTTATLLARAKVHPSVAQKIIRHANIETTLAVYTHVEGIEACVPRWRNSTSAPLEERAPAPVVPLRKTGTFATNLLPAAVFPKDEAPDRLAFAKKIRGLQWSGRLDLNQRPLAPHACPEAAQASSTLRNAAEPFRSAPLPAVQGSQRCVTIHRDFATNLLPAIE